MQDLLPVLLFARCSYLVQDRLAAETRTEAQPSDQETGGLQGSIIDGLAYVQQSREKMEVFFMLPVREHWEHWAGSPRPTYFFLTLSPARR